MPRFRLRTLMVAVAVSGVLLGAGSLLLRRERYRARAALHAERERIYAGTVEVLIDEAALARDEAERADRDGFKAGATIHLGTAAYFEELAAADRSQAQFHAIMRRKYERAAVRPWLPVAPDPPEPK